MFMTIMVMAGAHSSVINEIQSEYYFHFTVF